MYRTRCENNSKANDHVHTVAECWDDGANALSDHLSAYLHATTGASKTAHRPREPRANPSVNRPPVHRFIQTLVDQKLTMLAKIEQTHRSTAVCLFVFPPAPHQRLTNRMQPEHAHRRPIDRTCRYIPVSLYCRPIDKLTKFEHQSKDVDESTTRRGLR